MLAQNQKGLAMIEMLPLLAIFVLLINFAVGFFGIIHSGILNSISSRNYAFETFRNRSNLVYLRDITQSDNTVYFSKVGMRYHGTVKEGARIAASWIVTSREIKFTDVLNGPDETLGASEHEKLKAIQENKRASEDGISEGVSPAWIRVLYGICLNANCGDA